MPDQEKLDQIMRKTGETHAKLTQQRDIAEQGRHQSLQEKEIRERKRAEYEADLAARQKQYEEDMLARQAKYEAELNEPLHFTPAPHDRAPHEQTKPQYHPESNKGPKPKKKKNKKKKQHMTEEQRTQKYQEKEALDRDHARQEDERRKQEDSEKAIAEQRDEERKQKEEVQKNQEERRKRRQDERKRRREDSEKKKEEAQRVLAEAQAEEAKRPRKQQKPGQEEEVEADQEDEDEDFDYLNKATKEADKKQNGIPSLNLQPRVNRAMMLEFDRDHRQSNFFIDPRYKKDNLAAEDLYEQKSDSFEEEYREKRHRAPKPAYDFFPAFNPERLRKKHTSKKEELALDQRRIEELAAPIIDKQVHELEGKYHDSGSEPSSASIYSEGFSHSSVSQSSTSSSAKSSSQSSITSKSSSESSQEWISTSSGYRTLEEAEAHAIDRMRRDDKALRIQRAYLKEQAELAHFEKQKRQTYREHQRQSSFSSQSSVSSGYERQHYDRKSERQPERKPERQPERQSERQPKKQPKKQPERKTERQPERQSEKQPLKHVSPKPAARPRSAQPVPVKKTEPMVEEKMLQHEPIRHQQEHQHQQEYQQEHQQEHQHQRSHSMDDHKKYMHEYNDDVAAEIAAARNDEEKYNAKYSKLQKDMQFFAEEAELVKEEAQYEAEVAYRSAVQAEEKAHEAEQRAHDLEIQAEQAEHRVEKLEVQAHKAEDRYHMIRQEWQEVQDMSASHETHLLRAQKRFELQADRYAYKADSPSHQESRAEQQADRYSYKADTPQHQDSRAYHKQQPQVDNEERRDQILQEHKSKQVQEIHRTYKTGPQPEIVFQPYKVSEYHGQPAKPEKQHPIAHFEKPKLKLQPNTDAKKLSVEKPFKEKKTEREEKRTSLKPATDLKHKTGKTPLITMPNNEKPKLKHPHRLANDEQKKPEEKTAAILPSRPENPQVHMITPIEQLPGKMSFPKELPEKLRMTKEQRKHKAPSYEKPRQHRKPDPKPEIPEVTKTASQVQPHAYHSEIMPNPRAKTAVPEKSKKPKKPKAAHSGDPQTHQSKKKMQKAVKDFDQPARPRTVYPKGYEPPKITPEPVNQSVSGKGLKKSKSKAPKRSRGDELWHSEPRRQTDTRPHTAADSRYMFYLEHTGNEVIGSALMEENEKERALQVYKSTKQQELKEEYDVRISEMTHDYRSKLRELDSSYADKKRDLDKDRRDLQQQVSEARDNFDNPRFGLEGERDTGIHFNENVDRLHRIEALRRIQPFEEEEEFEEEPYIDEPFGDREDEISEFGFGAGDGVDDPPMVEMEASLIHGFGGPYERVDPLLHEYQLPQRHMPAPQFEMYPPTVMPYYEPQMMQAYSQMEGPVMPVATATSPIPFNFEIIRPVGWQLGHKPEKENRRPARDKKTQLDQTTDPLAEIKQRERDLNTEKHAREVELQQDYETRLTEFERDYQEKERELEKEKLDLERRLIEEREEEIDAETSEYRRQQRTDAKEDADIDEEDDLENEDELPDSELDDDYDTEDEDYNDYYANSSEEELINAAEEEAMMAGEFGLEEAEFYDEPHLTDKGIYELEWQLEPTPKQPAQPKLSEPAETDAPKKERKSKKGKEDKKQKRKNPATHKSSRRNPHKDRNERGTRRHKNRKNQEEKPIHRHRHRNVQNELTSEATQMQNGVFAGDAQTYHLEPELQYETYQLATPKLPKLPVTRVPIRPRHPLGRKYSHGLEPSLEQLLLAAHDQAMIDSHIEYNHSYPMPQQYTTYKHSPHALIAREPYGPQHYSLPQPHMLTKPHPDDFDAQYRALNKHVYKDKKQLELQLFGADTLGQDVASIYPYAIDDELDYQKQPEYQALASHFFENPHYEKYDQYFGGDLDHYYNNEFGDFSSEYDSEDYSFGPADFDADANAYYSQAQDYYSPQNGMSMRAFPTIKPIQYDPDAMAVRLAKARELGNLPPLEGEMEEQEALIHHRRQTHSFDLGKEREQILGHQQEPEVKKPKEVKEPKKVRRQKVKKLKQAPTATSTQDKAVKQKQQQSQQPHKPVLPVDERKLVQHPFEQKEDDLPNVLKQEQMQQKDQQPQRRQQRKQEQFDLTNPQAFVMPKQDPLGIDFEKIAMRRAQKQATFRRKETEEEAEWDAIHGGRFQYADEHLSGDKEMLDSKQHASLQAAFHRNREEHAMKELMKPKFEDFRLQFVSPHDQVADKISSADIMASQQAEMVKNTEVKDQLPKQINFDQIARERRQTHESFHTRYIDEQHPQDGQGGRLQYETEITKSGERASHPGYQEKHEQRRLEQLGIDFASTFDIREQPTVKSPRALSLQQISEQKKSPAQQQQKQSQQYATKIPRGQASVIQTTPLSSPTPRTTMVPPTRVGEVDITEEQSPLLLDVTRGSPLRMATQKAEQAAVQLEKALEDPGVHHFWQGQQHSEHKFSLMDPVHPAKHRAQEQVFDEHFSVDDPHKQIKEGQPDPLPMFNPARAYAQQQTYMQPSYAMQPQSMYGGYMPQQMPIQQQLQPRSQPQYITGVIQQQPTWYAQPQQQYARTATVQRQQQYISPAIVQQVQPIKSVQQQMPWMRQPQQPQQQQYGYPQQQQSKLHQYQPAPMMTQINPPQSQMLPKVAQEQYQGTTGDSTSKSVVPTKSLPYEPKPAQQPIRQPLKPTKQPTMQTQQPQQQPIQQSQLQQRSMMISQPSNPEITVTKTLAPQKRRNAMSNYGDYEEQEFDHNATIHSYEGDDHPIVVTATGADAFVAQHEDQVVVGDHESDLDLQDIEDMISNQGTLSSWGTALFLDTKHDLTAAWESNRKFHE